MPKTSLFELKEKLFTFDSEINSINEWLAEKAADPNIQMKDIEDKQDKLAELRKRREILQKQHDDIEDQQRTALAMQKGAGNGMTEKDIIIKNKAAFYRAAITGGDVTKAFEGLGAIPANTADLGYGEHFLPKNLAKELLTEPVEENTLRRVEPVTQISGLEEAKIDFTIDEASLADVTDRETAKEITMTGSTVSYGRYKTKIFATIKDTVLYGSDFDLVTKVEAALRSGLAVKEKI